MEIIHSFFLFKFFSFVRQTQDKLRDVLLRVNFFLPTKKNRQLFFFFQCRSDIKSRYLFPLEKYSHYQAHPLFLFSFSPDVIFCIATFDISQVEFFNQNNKVYINLGQACY